jgi:ribosomal protein L37AE/L43A
VIAIRHRESGGYEEQLEKTEYHCPKCGNKNVWVEDSEGDYYVGSIWYCLDCHFGFTFQPNRIYDKSEVSFEDRDASWLANNEVKS